MRIWHISDLHLNEEEMKKWSELDNIPEADIAVILGDVSDDGLKNIEWCGKHIIPHMPVIYVPGNHDFYNSDLHEIDIQARELAKKNNIIYLNKDTVIIDGIRFIGGALWSDFRVNGFKDDLSEEENIARNIEVAKKKTDFKKIFICKKTSQNITPYDTAEIHKTTRDFFQKELSQKFDGKTIVLSHFSPLKDSTMEEFEKSPTHPSYASDQSDVVTKYKPEMWLFAHIHGFFEKNIHGTKFACNPRGYDYEDTGFKWNYIHQV